MNMPARATAVAFAAALALLAGLLPATLAGQQRPPTPIFLAVPQIFPAIDARLILIREPGRDIVVLDPADVTPETLSVGLHLLGKVDRPRPEPGRGQMIPVTGFVRDGELRADERAALESALSELRSQPIGHIGNLGEGRWVPFVQP